MKDRIENVFEIIIKKTKTYRKIEKESENYNDECRKKEERIKKLKEEIKQCIAEKQECVLSGQSVIEEKEKQTKALKEEIAKLEKKLENKELQRRKNAGSIGGLKRRIATLEKEIEGLKETNDFLRKHRRAPSIEELREYDMRRKRSVSK